MLIPTIIDSHLRVDGNLIGHDLANQIFDELTIENSAKEYAKNRKQYGWWDMPDDFLLAELDGDTVVMPRGYALQYKLLLREHGHKVRWVDRRTWKRGPKIPWAKPFEPREHQPLAVKMMRKHQQGIYQAPTGSGKSLSVIMLIQLLSPAKSIIYVDKKDLLNQWIKNISEWLGPEYVGQIGNGKWDDSKRITVATVQSIWSKIRKNDLPSDWYDRHGLVVLDECHHVTADTIEHIVGSHSARIREGVSATPDKEDDKFEKAQAVLGEVFHEDDEERLIEAGVLSKPYVEVIKTDFEFAYWPSHEAVEEENDGRFLYLCQKPGCKLIHRPHGHKDNYQALKDALVADAERNDLIAWAVANQAAKGEHHHLVVSDEIRHLDAIMASRWLEAYHDPGHGPNIYVLTGQINGNKRKALIAEIEQQDEAIIFATVAKEGLDIPRIDRVYLPWPSSSAPGTKQKVGRATRVAEGKKDAIVFDFLDVKVKKLKHQFRARRFGFYDKAGMEVRK